MVTVRKLTETGLVQFRAHLEQLSAGAVELPPAHLLDDQEHSEALRGCAEVENIVFASKQAAAEYLTQQLAALDRSEVDHNVGLWSWLSLFYFDQVGPSTTGGRREPGQIERHIPSLHAWTYYRHLLAGPCRLLHLHGPNARLFLHGPLHKHGDFSEQLASRMELITNGRLIEAVNRLYFSPDADGGQPKRGAATRTRHGNVRRLVAVIQQFDLTYDLYAMTADQILALLPPEFNHWRRITTTA
jgi:hypothetical protein